jgi:hypothetical protein
VDRPPAPAGAARATGAPAGTVRARGPRPHRARGPVLVRFALDAGDDGPPLEDIDDTDEIVEGSRVVGDTGDTGEDKATGSGSGGGVGSSLGPA